MSLRPLHVAGWILVVSALSFAQDPTRVEPSHYKVAFENGSVQVVNVHYGPHEKSVLHDHPGGVVVVITGGHLKFTDESGTVTEVFSKAGESRWFPPFRHKVENVGDTPYNAVYIGIKTKQVVSKNGAGTDSLSKSDAGEIAKVIAESISAAHAQ
jgi:quercetin dioxygenase-like cupin family protein